MTAVTLESFMTKVYPEPNTGCWLWGGKTGHFGYGNCQSNKLKLKDAHRMSYYFHFGDFNRKLFVLHKCDVPSCVNPDHLYLGTQADNMRDRKTRNRFIAKNGEDHARAKLTEKQAINVHKLYNSGKYTQAEIAKKYNVSETTIRNLYIFRNWKHLKFSEKLKG